MSYQIKLRGMASGSEHLVNVSPGDFEKTLMKFLQEAGFPIASSCSGEGICKKCVVNNDLLSCQISVADFLLMNVELVISYL